MGHDLEEIQRLLELVEVPPPVEDMQIFGHVVPNDLDENSLNALSRNHRDMLLAASDYTQMADYPLTDEKRAEWSVYRQALRDLPDHPDWPQVEEPQRPL